MRNRKQQQKVMLLLMPLQKLIINPKKIPQRIKKNTDQADSEEADDSDNVYKNGNFEGSGPDTVEPSQSR